MSRQGHNQRSQWSRVFLAAMAALPLAVLVAPAVGVEPTTPDGASSDLWRTENTTDEEKLAYAAQGHKEIRDAEAAIVRLLEQNKDNADAVECLTKRKTSVSALLAVVKSAEISLKTAITQGNDAMADHEYRKIAVAVVKTRVLLSDAQKCASGEQLESGTTIIDWALDDDQADLFPELTLDDLDIDPNPPSITEFQ